MAPFPSKQEPTRYQNGQTFGRPSQYRPEYCEAVINSAKELGLSLTAFAGVIGVSVNAVYEWKKSHADFGEACSRAASARVLWWELKLGRSRKGAETTAAIFALKNAAPLEWRDVKHTEHSHRLTADRLTDEQLHAIAAGGYVPDADTIDGQCERVKG